MARELEFRVLCDLCQDGGVKVDAIHQDIGVSIGGAPERFLDLCQGHHVLLLRPLLQALDRHGHDPQRKRTTRSGRPRREKLRAEGPFQCRVPGCLAAPLKHRDSFWQHLRGLHDGMTLEEYQELYGEAVPMTDEELAELVVEATCQLCGQTYSTAKGNRWPRQALVSHLRGHHRLTLAELEAGR